mmetsp:Transcript_10215/g.46844  ORF Transcript_10215/g.46844 Transcript_10215/m.46844 type:complete len:277 (-) Transcript_10215:30-860(-)
MAAASPANNNNVEEHQSAKKPHEDRDMQALKRMFSRHERRRGVPTAYRSHPRHLQHHLVRLQEPRRPRRVVPGRHDLRPALRLDPVSFQRPSQLLSAVGDERLSQVAAERVHREGPRWDVLDGDVGVRGVGRVRSLGEATGGHEEGHLVGRLSLRSLGRADGGIGRLAGRVRHQNRRGHGYRGRGVVLGLGHDADVLRQPHERSALVALEHSFLRRVRCLRDDRGGVSPDLVEAARGFLDDIVARELLRDLPEDGSHDDVCSITPGVAAVRVRSRE